jgi:hypothetical protein
VKGNGRDYGKPGPEQEILHFILHQVSPTNFNENITPATFITLIHLINFFSFVKETKLFILIIEQYLWNNLELNAMAKFCS